MPVSRCDQHRAGCAASQQVVRPPDRPFARFQSDGGLHHIAVMRLQAVTKEFARSGGMNTPGPTL
jgi:hypothetical protein